MYTCPVVFDTRPSIGLVEIVFLGHRLGNMSADSSCFENEWRIDVKVSGPNKGALYMLRLKLKLLDHDGVLPFFFWRRGT
jgi:hypothetical protein